MIKARIKYKDGREEPMEFRRFDDYGRYIDENREKIAYASTKNVRPIEIRKEEKTD